MGAVLRPLPLRIMAVFAASGLAGLTLAAEFFVYALAKGRLNSTHDMVVMAMLNLLGGLNAALGYVMGFALIGLPLWIVMHRLRWVSAITAVLAGAVAAVIADALWLLAFAKSDAPQLLQYSLVLALPGAVAGGVVWAIGYEAVSRPPPARPS